MTTEVDDYFRNQLNEIRSMLVLRNITDATSILNQTVRSSDFQNYVLSKVSDYGLVFVRSGLARFSFEFIEEGDREKQEVDFVPLFTRQRFLFSIFEVDDLVNQFLHEVMHECARVNWKRCSIKKDIFDFMELDFFEEIYGQAFIYTVCPAFYDLFPKAVDRYRQYRGLKSSQVFAESFSMLTKSPVVNFKPLIVIHSWLYSQSELLNAKVFNQYISACALLLNSAGFSIYLKPRWDLHENRSQGLWSAPNDGDADF